MTEMYPAYYEAFRCTAGACRHNCCIGWEIDIDGKSAERYAALPGAFGERVRAAVEPGEPPHFRLDAAGRCAMLREDNLCELQRTLGESALCNICRDHPRYRVFLPGRMEIGLGLCCEEAARLLLSQTEKVTLRGAVSKAPPRETVELLLFRQKLLDAAQDRRLTLGGRMQKFSRSPALPCPGGRRARGRRFSLLLNRWSRMDGSARKAGGAGRFCRVPRRFRRVGDGI